MSNRATNLLDSDLLTPLQGLRDRTALGSALFGKQIRPLQRDEIEQLEAEGNRCRDWRQVYVVPEFRPVSLGNNRLSGRVILGDFSVSGGIYHSCLEDAEIASGALIDHCLQVRRTLVMADCDLRGAWLDCSTHTSYGLGTEIHAGLETPGREIRLWDKMTLDSAQLYLTDAELRAQVQALAEAVTFDRSILWPGVQVIQCPRMDRVWLGPATLVQGALRVENCAAMGNAAEPVKLGTGVQVVNAVFQPGVSLESGAQVDSSVFLEWSGAQRQALVTESLIGPNSIVGGGEVTASFLGPFVGFHHQSLLIAAWWPEGRGNIGYGANIGSNHTSRSPDQEIRPGEGTFFGLATAVKFPANFQDSPYSILASGVVTLPQRLSLPFSLILDEPLDTPETRGLNRVIPGWVLKENVYLLLRNEMKFASRSKARRHQFDFRIFRPEIVDKLWKTRVDLVNTVAKAVHTKHTFPAVGKNYLLEEDRIEAIRVYLDFLKYGVLKLFAEASLDGIACPDDWLQTMFRRLNLDYFSTAENLRHYLELEQRLLESSVRAKTKDNLRGTEIIPDYAQFHAPAEEDAFLVAKRQQIETLRHKILAFESG
ncbi:MAG: DUF4954 family protein [Spirochaetales bacterium]